MLLPSKSLEKFNIETKEGNQAKLMTFFCDQDDWSIKHFLARTGSRLMGRQILVDPGKVYRMELAKDTIHVDMDKKELSKAPGIKKDEPVSDILDSVCIKERGIASDPAARNWLETPEEILFWKNLRNTQAQSESSDDLLRSVQEMRGYSIASKEGAVAKIDDFIVHTDGWFVYGCVIEMGDLFSKEKRIIPMAWIDSVSWAEKSLTLSRGKNIQRDALKFSPDKPANSKYELRIYDFKGSLYSVKKAPLLNNKRASNQ